MNKNGSGYSPKGFDFQNDLAAGSSRSSSRRPRRFHS